MFLNIRELRIKKLKIKFRKNCHDNMVSDFLEKCPELSVKLLRHKLFLKFGLSSGKFRPSRTL